MIAVVVGLEDPASRNVRDQLLEKADWREETVEEEGFERVHQFEGFVMVEKEGMHLYFEEVDQEVENLGFDVELVVFVSRHSGDTGQLLSAHHTGNWAEAEHGGRPGSLATPAPDAHRHLLQRFDEDAPDGWQVSMEATHHGPSELSTPSVYAEVGSGEKQWRDVEAAEVVASAVLSLPDRREPRWTLVGVGGGHYSPRFTRVALETEAAFGHVAPDHHLEDVDKELLRRAFEQSDADHVLFDGEAEDMFDVGGLPVVSESYLRRRSYVAEDVADEIDDVLGSTWTATERAEELEGGREVLEFQGAELVREAYATDSDAAVEALDAYAVAYVVNSSGVVDKAAVEASGVVELARALADVLRARYDVEVDEEARAVRAGREVFDVERARELGVPEGPAFGRLSSGEPVDVDGETVEPEDVVERVELELGF